MNAGELVISLLLKSGGFKTQVQDAQKDLDKTGDAGQQAMKKTGDAAQKAGKELEGAALKGAGGFGRLLPVLGKTVALLGGMAALKGMASHYLDTAAAIDRTSRSLGMNMQRLQAWQGAAQTVGVEAEEVGNFFRDFNDYIVDANKFDSGPLKDIAKELGIGLQDARGQARATEDVVMDLADAFQRVGNQQATAYGMQLSLDPGMIALMQRGGKELGGLLKAQKELAVYQEEDAELARKMNIAWQTLTKGLEAGGAQIMRVVGSPLAWLAEKLSASVVWMRDNQTFVTAFFTVLAGILLKLGIPAMLSFAKATMAAMAPLMPLVAIVTAAALAFDDLWAFITGGDSALERFALKLGVSQETIESVREALRSVVGFFLDLWDAVTGEGKNGRGVGPGQGHMGSCPGLFCGHTGADQGMVFRLVRQRQARPAGYDSRRAEKHAGLGRQRGERKKNGPGLSVRYGYHRSRPSSGHAGHGHGRRPGARRGGHGG